MYRTSTLFTHGRSRGGGSKPIIILICFRLYKNLKQRMLIHRRLSAISVLAVTSSFQTGVGDGDVPRGQLRAHPRLRGHPHDRCEGYSGCLLARFTGKDADLVAAQAAFDVLNNPAASTAQDMGMDEG